MSNTVQQHVLVGAVAKLARVHREHADFDAALEQVRAPVCLDLGSLDPPALLEDEP